LESVVGALAAAAAGLVDWMEVDPPEKAIGAFHATLNVSATLFFMVSFLLRWFEHWRPGWGAFAVALMGYVLVMGGGYLGGILVFHLGVMINRNAYRSGPEDFTTITTVGELAEDELKRVVVHEQPVLLVKVSGRIHAVGAVCSHYGAPLNEGRVVDNTIECPWHASRFALEDGMVVQGPACAALPVYDCRIVNAQVQIEMRTENKVRDEEGSMPITTAASH
jgi:nitrite reductase/ring-hydroxylating ferredoxin subunit